MSLSEYQNATTRKRTVSAKLPETLTDLLKTMLDRAGPDPDRDEIKRDATDIVLSEASAALLEETVELGIDAVLKRLAPVRSHTRRLTPEERKAEDDKSRAKLREQFYATIMPDGREAGDWKIGEWAELGVAATELGKAASPDLTVREANLPMRLITALYVALRRRGTTA